jgi:glycosyltransferase involved in cell wall biosynthesis
MRKINILYVITKLELGGAQKHLLSLITNLDKSKYNIFLFTAKEGLLLNDALAIVGLCIKTSSNLTRPINSFKDLPALFEIYNFIKNHNIDIVHTHSSKAGIIGRLAAKLAKVKIIIHTVHGWPFNDYQRFVARYLYIWLERFAAQFSDKLIVVSGFDKEKGLRNYIGNNNKYILIHYGILLKNFAISEYKINNIRKECGLRSNDLAIGMIACFKPQKAPQDFIKLACLTKKDRPDIKFILIGDGILRRRIEDLITRFKLKNQVFLLGWRKDISEILSAIDIFVLTSLWEGLPIAVLEAMASAKPVVATDTGGIREIVSENETGFLVRPGDMKSMAEKLKLLLTDAQLREEIGRNARNSLGSAFSLEIMVGRTQDLYGNLSRSREEERTYAN